MMNDIRYDLLACSTALSFAVYMLLSAFRRL